MNNNTMMTAAFALAVATGPALAQDTTTGGQSTATTTMTPDSTMPTPATTTADGTAQNDIAAKAAPTMSKSQMAAMQKCQAMTADMMMKNRKCMKMAKMHPEMMPGATQGTTPATTG